MPDFAWRFLRAAGGRVAARNLDLKIEGQDRIPTRGPVLLAARHFHHLYDGCVILTSIPRPVHILVGLDWVSNPMIGRVMRFACRSARWPVVARPGAHSGVTARDAAIAFRQAANDSLDLFREGRILLVFPEGYPNIDPSYTPKRDESEFLPFQQGYLRLVKLAAREVMEVPVVPVGLEYQRGDGDRWQVTLRFGDPVTVDDADAARDIEHQVRALSGAPR